MNKKYIGASLGIAAGITMIIPAFAENTPTTNNDMRRGRPNFAENESRGEVRGKGLRSDQMGMRPTVSGVVTLISGNTITISGHQGMASSSAPQTTFTIDATNAKIMKANVTSAISSIVVGDTIAVSGTLTGTSVVATMIRDGAMMGRGGEIRNNNAINKDAQAMQQLRGNGQPVVAGTITAITGSTVTITNKSNVTYTAETNTAKIIVSGATSTLASVKVGDAVVIQGTVNGTAITASTVIDSGTPKALQANTVMNNLGQDKKGFFSGLGGFFGRMFGF